MQQKTGFIPSGFISFLQADTTSRFLYNTYILRILILKFRKFVTCFIISMIVTANPLSIQKQYAKWAEEVGVNKWIVLGRISKETGMYKFKTDSSRNIH